MARLLHHFTPLFSYGLALDEKVSGNQASPTNSTASRAGCGWRGHHFQHSAVVIASKGRSASHSQR